MRNDSRNTAMEHVSLPGEPRRRILTGSACHFAAVCGALMLAPQPPERCDSRAEAIAALAEVGGVMRYDDQGRPVWLGFIKGKRDVDDAALANVAKLCTLEEISFYTEGPGRRELLPHPLVTDEALVRLRALPRLRVLDLSMTGVRGPGLVQLQGNKQLADLNLMGVPLGDDGLRYLAGFRWLSSLTLDDDSITGNGLAHLAGLTNLRSLRLSCRRVGPEGLAHLSRMIYLNALYLHVRELDHIEFLRNFTRLTRLSLDGAPIDDADLADIAGLKGLTTLALDYTQIGDGGLRHLVGLSNLSFLDLSGTRVTDAGLDQLPPLSECLRLTIQRTAVTLRGVARLKAKYPGMVILW